MEHGLRMGLRDGVSMNFWQDRWIDSGERLIDLALGDHSAIDTDQPVSAFISCTGEWNWSLFSHLLTPGARLQVAGMSPPVSGAGEDQITWGLERDERFRLRSAYSLLADDAKEPREGIWKTIWRWKGPQRVRQFLWLVAHHRLLTNGERRRRHLTEIGVCQVYPEQEEIVLHVLRDCPLASATWELLAFPSDNLMFFQTPLLPWIEDFIRRPELSLLFGATCWFLWRYRNDRVFNDKLTTAVTLTRHIQAWVALVGDTLDRDRSITDVVPPARTEVCISWEPAPLEWENLGICSITRAELRGVVPGLQLAWDRGYRKVQLHIDSQCAVLLLQSDDRTDHLHAATIRRARELLHRDWEVHIRQVFRESNHVADHLANSGHSCPIGFHCIELSDSVLSFWLLHDQLGVSETRLIMNER
ncbi:Putative ribonuclease H protein At1g65750 [Linum perenne]